MVGKYVSGLATGAVVQLPHKMQVGLLGALVKVDDPLVEIIDLVGETSPQNASRALAGTIATQAGLPCIAPLLAAPTCASFPKYLTTSTP